MGIIKLFRSLLIIIILIGGGYYLFTNSDSFRDQALSLLHINQQGVKAASTKRGQEITNQFKSEIGVGVNSLEKQVMNLKISDAVSLISKFHNVPSNIHTIQNFVTSEINSYTQKK